MDLTPQVLSSLAGAALSALLSVGTLFPKFGAWWNQFNDGQKQVINGTIVVVFAVAIFVVSCLGVVDWVECSEAGLLSFSMTVLAALGGNFAIYGSFGKAIKSRQP